MLDEGQLLGRGIQFPPNINSEGRWAWSSGPENIRQSIRLILQTEPLERIMLPEFGGGLKALLFQPNVVATHRLVEQIIQQSLERWEPRINLESVDVRVDPKNPQAAIASIRYSLVATEDVDQMQLRVLLTA